MGKQTPNSVFDLQGAAQRVIDRPAISAGMLRTMTLTAARLERELALLTYQAERPEQHPVREIAAGLGRVVEHLWSITRAFNKL